MKKQRCSASTAPICNIAVHVSADCAFSGINITATFTLCFKKVNLLDHYLKIGHRKLPD